jgi:alpha-amylase/alpha-mannosidase (GH57 family)
MTRVALLWHMHQPYYVDRSTNVHILPWVRLHALKDYWGMVALTREFPTLRVTFNLVPSLLDQIEAFARDEARDPHLHIGLRDAAALTADEARFCLDEFFHAHHGRMVRPHPRFAELLERRDSVRRGGPALTVEELRDLQVWHKLAWVDPFYETDPRIAALHARQREFAEADKHTLRTVELEILRRVVPEYRQASDEGRIELSTSPYYHPILPLLCDVGVYARTHPSWPPPEEPFRYPDDAAAQLERSIELHSRLFGTRPRGLWPSEGSVSDEMVAVVADRGFSWMATDETILGLSLGLTFGRESSGTVHNADALYRAYDVGPPGKALGCGFRDRALSDLIGFSYATWEPEAAAQDFVRRVEAAGASAAARGEPHPTVFVVLDGENAWEHYAGQGRPFLRALYGALTRHTGLQTVTMSDACASPTTRLPSLTPGSWIHGDFYIWAGHADDRRAWGQLARARRALEQAGLANAGYASARESLLVAEGSDWFWWYGDDHSSDHDRAFDDLYRRHVQHVYTALDLPVPDDLWRTNISTDAGVQPTRPVCALEPTLDGRDTSYYEWLGAGWFETRPTAGAMHQTSARPALAGLRFGFDPQGGLWLCLVAADPSAAAPWVGARIWLTVGAASLYLDAAEPASAEGRVVSVAPGWRAAIGAHVEAWVTRDCLLAAEDVTVTVSVELSGRRETWSMSLPTHIGHEPGHWRA